MSVDVEWSKGHMSVIGPYTLTCWMVLLRMVNLRPDGALREKQRIVGWEGRGE
jgi:hypothetical protein